MTDYPDEVDIKDYKQRFNDLPAVQDNNLKLVSSTFDTIKTICLIGFGVVIICLIAFLWLINGGSLTPVINNDFAQDILVTNNDTISPVVNVYVNVQVNNTEYNVSSFYDLLNHTEVLNVSV